MNNKKKIILGVSVVVLLLSFGLAFALWTYSNTLGNQTLISGEIFLKYTEGDTVNMKEAMPSVTYNPEEYFEFSIEGKNKYSKDIVFEILLDEGDEPSGDENKSRTERIKPELLKFRLVEVKTDADGNEQEEELIQEASYDSIQKRRIWVDRVKAGTKENIKYTYRLYMWISIDAKIGNMEDADYTAQVWNNNVYASVKVAVNGDFNPKDLTEDYLILNATNESGEKYDLKQPIQSDEDITITLGSKREVTKFVVEKSEQNPIALTSLEEPTDYPVSYNKATRAWEAKVTIDETGIYDYYAEYEAGKNSKTYSFTVLMNPDRYVKVAKPTEAMCKQGLIYNGKTQDLVEKINPEGYTYKNHQQKDANTYQITATLQEKFKWADSSQDEVTFSCSISPKDLTVTPKSNQSKTYGDTDKDLTYDYVGQVENETPVFNGKLKRAAGDDKGTYQINQGDLELTDGNNFKASNYTLKFSTSVVNFTINPKPVTNVTVKLGSTDFIYDGHEKQPIVESVLDGDKPLIVTTDYTVSYSNNTIAGTNTAKVIITGQGNYTGTKEVPFTIKKAATTLTYEPTSGFSVEKGAKKTFKINASVTGTFKVTSKASGTASVTFTPTSGTSTTVTVTGEAVGSTTLDITFIPTDKNYETKTESYNVTIKIQPGVAINVLKDTLGIGGLIGVTTDNTKTTSKTASNIREYRYSGEEVNNYAYFNCSDSTGVQNSNNCETWRIIGIFKDESGNEHIKIVRNSTSTTMKWDSSCSPTSYTSCNQSWTSSTAAVRTYLNGEYLTSLTSNAKNMIEEETKWYLGKVTEGDTTVNLYTKERITSDYSPWPGKIGLMYPSDYGYSVDSSYWATKTNYSGFVGKVLETSWLYKTANHSDNEWFLSPTTHSSYAVAEWTSTGYIGNGFGSAGKGIRPALYLKSNVQITGNDGTSLYPYMLSVQ